MPRDALIVGLGLIGGSIGIALRRRGWHVAYEDPHVDLSAARDSGAADDRFDSVTVGDVVVIATSVDIAVALLPELKTGAVVTSVCSVMKPLRDVARGRFVAGHPMAGSAKIGLRHATVDLFHGRPWFLDAEESIVDELVRDCGGMIDRVDATEHDAAMALTSHLPQVLSTALAAYLETFVIPSEVEGSGREGHDSADDRAVDVLRFAGPGLRDFLRLADSDISMWKSILDANRANLAPHADELTRVMREIVEGDPAEPFAKARRVFDKLR